MSGIMLVRGARQLLTLHGATEARRGPALQELGIIRDGALLIVDGRVVEVGPSRRVENLAQAHRCQEIDATGRVVMPGFVDCHTHLVWGAGWLDDFDARPAEAAKDTALDPICPIGVLRNASGKRLQSRAREWIHGMVRHGTTTLGAQSGYGLDQRAELKILRVHARLNRAPLDIASTFLAACDVPALLGMPSDLLAAVHRRNLARFAGVRHDGRTCGLDQSRNYLETARSLGFQLKVQAGNGFTAEAVRLAVQMGAVSVDHLGAGSLADLELLAASNTIAVLLPGSAFHCGNGGCAPARKLIDGGAAVALGSDFNPRTNPSYNMQTIVALACAHLGMSPAEAICAATFNAACAIGAGQVAGSLEAGKPADLIVLNAADYREIPYHFGVNLVHRTVKRGVTIYEEGSVAR